MNFAIALDDIGAFFFVLQTLMTHRHADMTYKRSNLRIIMIKLRRRDKLHLLVPEMRVDVSGVPRQALRNQ
jgi:hypothetical protein